MLTACSRSASLREVFWSVDALRWPMISAHGTRYSPAGNFFSRVPGMTTRAGRDAAAVLDGLRRR